MNNNGLKDTILSVNEFLEDFNPSKISKGISDRLKQRRLELNLTQSALSKMSGVSLGTLKRFENKHEISLKSLIKLAISLNASDDFKKIFTKQNFENISDVINTQNTIKRQRGRKNV
ncbi:MAG: helix-turn-helix transcriptional regulator [Endomicrobiia bacterium]|jgi:transcriptional regulator with XRE-family HTH domain|nr:helix-turn-helix transcriptional regulator [Endomicrobiaceae bacterium]MDD3053909.1 helix-turn-helix transcriptional regulator [Endomicrobiaceae bacterium]MDD3923178.1 helix-turn-helix transcriptional regulator [Endomicrobiaceae bacterium]MEA5000284.1 helix-turn-helix transcriptional regulator [Endomicrobiaceae bacterium]